MDEEDVEQREAGRQEVRDGAKRLHRLRADPETYQRLLRTVTAALRIEDALNAAEAAGVEFGIADEESFAVLRELGELLGLFGDDVWDTAGEPDEDGLRWKGPRVAADPDAIQAHVEANHKRVIEWMGSVDALGALADAADPDASPG